MKILILITLIYFYSVFAQNTIQVINIDESVSEYQIEELDNIAFEIENTASVKVFFFDESINEIEINNSFEIYFENDEIIFSGEDPNNSNQNQDYRYKSNSIQSLQFISKIAFDRYPFGELEVEEIVLSNLTNPWSIDFLDESNIIFTELDGRLYTYDIYNDNLVQIGGLPEIQVVGQGGLIDVTLHPDFVNNKLVYLAYSVGANWEFTTAIGRGVLNGNQIVDFEEIFRGSPLVDGGVHFGSSIIFDNEGKLYFSIGDRGNQNNAQNNTNHYGSVLRINDDGTIPDDNTFLGNTVAQPELYTLGNRNIQGMFYLSEKDEIWAVEHGPRGGDELNIIQSGENYSWPLATYGINYNGTPITETRVIEGHIAPITYWVPSIAPCGMDLISYNSDNNELDIIIATLAGQHLHRLRIRDNEVVETSESLRGYARFRDIQLSPDGFLYAATQNPSRIIKLRSKE